MSSSDNVSPGEGYLEIKEGLASMWYDKNEEVFYNKVQVFNRDTSIQVIKLFGETFDKEKKAKYDKKMERFGMDPSKFEHEPTEPTYGIHVLDALAATGLRSVRYVKEIPCVNKVTINDLLPAATAAAQVTCERNGVDPQKISINTGVK
jgi:tRNA (guanine26-N2/guanine27-N2)-dimethyltransferase